MEFDLHKSALRDMSSLKYSYRLLLGKVEHVKLQLRRLYVRRLLVSAPAQMPIQSNLSICMGSGRLFCMHLERYAVTEVFTV